MERDLLAPAGNAAKFDVVGKTYTGTILNKEQRQQRDYATGEPKTWGDGSPQMEVILTIVTTTDELPVNIYCRGNMLRAVKEAIAAAGERTAEIGGTLTIKYVGDGEPAKPGFSPPKLYKAAYKAPVNTPDDDDLF